jgi:ATP-binding protein involved in chromosome partitioning
MRIALPLVQGKLSMHFGHCEQFALVDVDPNAKCITSITNTTPPPHEPGLLPKWLAGQDVTLVIAGGMGGRAQGLFTDKGIEVVVGAQPALPEETVIAYLNDELQTGNNICDH